MSTVTESPPAVSTNGATQSLFVAPVEQRFVYHAANWEMYEGFLAAIGKRHIRVTYHRGSLELMAPSWNHEWWSRRLDKALTGVGMALDVDFVGAGSTTFRRQDVDAGLEPDQCYYTVNAHRMLGLRELDLSVDPPPDLALEVDFTHSSLDRMAIYAALGVAEVWRWDASGIHIYHLQQSGDRREYASAERSLSFPVLPMDRLLDFLLATQDLPQVKVILAARDWAAAGFPTSSAPAQ